MPKPFYTRLAKYYADVAASLRGDAAAAAVFPNPTDIGDAREKLYIEFLRRHLPANCDIVQGGFLFDLQGNESAQLDVIVSTNSSLRFRLASSSNGTRGFACVEGTIAVASLKSNLTTANLKDAIRNIATIPATEPVDGRHSIMMRINNYDNFPFKIVYAPDGVSAETASSTVARLQEEIPASRFPDIIHVASKYAFIKSPNELKTSDGAVIPANTVSLVQGRPDLQALVFATTEIQAAAMAAQHINYNYSALLWGVAENAG